MQHLPAFFAAAATSLVVPGPDFVLVTRHGLTSGRAAAATTATGIVTGLAVHATLAVAGVAALLTALPGALTVLRLAGAAYLIVLGALALYRSSARAARTRPPEAAGQPARGTPESAPATPTGGAAPARVGLRGPFLQGLLNNLLNPKAVVFFVALLPSFVSAGGSTAGQTALLAGTVLGMAVGWWALCVTLLARLGRSWQALRRPRAERIIGRSSGVALIAVGGAISVPA